MDRGRARTPALLTVRVDRDGHKNVELEEKATYVPDSVIVELMRCMDRVAHFPASKEIGAAYEGFGDKVAALIGCVDRLRQLADLAELPPPLPIFYLPRLAPKVTLPTATVATQALPAVCAEEKREVLPVIDMKKLTAELWRNVDWLQTEKPAFDERMKSLLEDKHFIQAVEKLQLELVAPEHAPCMYKFMAAAVTKTQTLTLAGWFAVVLFNKTITGVLISKFGVSPDDAVRLRHKAEVSILQNLHAKEAAARRVSDKRVKETATTATSSLDAGEVDNVLAHGLEVRGRTSDDLRNSLKRKREVTQGDARMDIARKRGDSHLLSGNSDGQKKRRHRRQK